MISVDVVNTKGKKTSIVKVVDSLLDAKINEPLLAQALRVFTSNQRQGTKKTLSRSEVAYTGGKMWRQKGTGRARHSSRRAPIFVGGGKAHGPTGRENYKMKLTKKMRRQALANALTIQYRDKHLTIVDDLKKVEPKTKNTLTAIKTLAGYPENKKVLIILEDSDQNVIKGSKNLKGVTTTQAKRINVYELLWHQHIVTTKDALGQLSWLIAGEEIKEAKLKTSKATTKTDNKNKKK